MNYPGQMKELVGLVQVAIHEAEERMWEKMRDGLRCKYRVIADGNGDECECDGGSYCLMEYCPLLAGKEGE